MAPYGSSTRVSVSPKNEAAGRSQVRFAFCKKEEVLREAVARLSRRYG